MNANWKIRTLLTVYLLGAWVATAAPANKPSPSANAETNSTPAAKVLNTSDAYQPVPMDKFIFRIQEDPSKGGEEMLTVSSLGEIRFPISRGAGEVITVSTRGKTLAEIKKELKQQLDAEYYQDATIFLRLQDQNVRPGKVYITGAIKQNIDLLPGDPKSVFTALLQVGSNDFANLKRVKLWRLNPKTQKDEFQVIDVKSMLDGGTREKDVLLQDGDRIEVPEKSFIF
jgi:hypothetical protein